jgi:hypothetical protein
MSENWSAIAAEIADAIGSVGFTAILEERLETDGPEGDTYRRVEDITVIDDQIDMRDAGGMITGRKRVLTIKGNGSVPKKGWRVEVRGEVHRIAAVRPLAPGGVDLLFDLELEG